MTTATRVLIYVGAAFVLLLVFQRIEDQASKAELKSLQAASDTLRVVLKAREASFRVDTVRLTRLATRSETTLVQLIDTAHVYHTDTVKITVEKLVQIDSTIHACMITVSDCTKGWQAEKAVNVNLEAQIKALKKQTGLLSRCGFVAGYGVILHRGSVLGGPGAIAGCRVWP
jgi:hypothetical protein